MGTFRFVVGFALAFSVAGLVHAQTLEEALGIRWKLDDDGNVCIQPDPSTPGVPDSATLIAAPMSDIAWMSLGSLGYVAVLCSGDGDLASTTDAVRFWERLGIDTEALVRKLGVPREVELSPTEEVQLLLAARALQDLDHKPAIGPLRQLAREDTRSAWLRRAVAEAIAELEGEPLPPVVTEVPALEKVLAQCPFDPHVLAVIDQTRLPSSRPLMALARKAMLAVLRRLNAPGGRATDRALQVHAFRDAEVPGTLPYEITRRFGNHRITRTVLVLRFADLRDPGAWLWLDGVFDVPALVAGFEAEDLPVERADGGVVVAIPGGCELRVTASHAVLRRDPQAAPPERTMDPESLARAFDGAPITLWLRDVPDPSTRGRTRLLENLLPGRICIRVPRATDDRFDVSLHCTSATTADTLEASLTDIPRLVERFVDDERLPGAVRDAIGSWQVERDGTGLRVRFRLPPLDDALIEAVAGSLR